MSDDQVGASTGRVAVLGASGNLGTAVVRALVAADREVLAVARRPPDHEPRAQVTWCAADVTRDDLVALLDGCTAVVHLVWLLQPERDPAAQWAVNVEGLERVLDAVATTAPEVLVVASSLGAYSPARSGTWVDESWPTHGIATSAYARQKAYGERLLDAFELRHDATRVVRLRPGVVFQAAAASEQRRLFAGALVPNALLAPGRLPALPHLPEVRFQAVHADDVATAVLAALERPVTGAFNLAADDVLSTADVAEVLETRTVRVPYRVARAALTAAFRLRLVPLPPDWLELALRSPLLDTTRAREELGWAPRSSGRAALAEVLGAMAAGVGGATPRLAPDADGRDVVGELATGQGARDDTDPVTRPPTRPVSVHPADG